MADVELLMLPGRTWPEFARWNIHKPTDGTNEFRTLGGRRSWISFAFRHDVGRPRIAWRATSRRRRPPPTPPAHHWIGGVTHPRRCPFRTSSAHPFPAGVRPTQRAVRRPVGGASFPARVLLRLSFISFYHSIPNL